MKYILNFLLFFTLIGCLIYAEEPDSDVELPSIILERGWFNFYSGIAPYQYLDGTLLNYKDVRLIASEAPGNNSILRNERIWYITNYVSLFLLAGSVVTWAVYDSFDLPHGTIIRPIAIFSSSLSFGSTVISNSLWRHNMRKAINRYNLYIQNIKI
jgi:hypothetical protein